MRGSSALAFFAVWTSALVLVGACGTAFTAADGSGDGGRDAPGSEVSIDAAPGVDGSTGMDSTPDHGTGTDGMPSDSPGHADGVGVEASSGDASSTEGGTVDASKDVVSGDVIVGTSKRVFITSTAFTGNLGGLSGADGACHTLASGAGLTGTFKAWLSSTTATAASRLTHSTGPYVLVNGVTVADSWTALTSGNLLAAIDVNEKGGPAPSSATACGTATGAAVWTSTAPNGTLGSTLGATCTDWTTSGPSLGAVLGFAARTDSSWTDGCSVQGAGATVCSGAAALYCFEQ